MTAFEELRRQLLEATKQKIRESTGKDARITSCISTIHELDKVCNRLARKLRDWYALYNPEEEHERTDHKILIDTILENHRPDKDGMGSVFRDEDTAPLFSLAQTMSSLYAQRDLLVSYLESVMKEHAPNTTAVAGGIIGAQLIQLAGSLERLAMMPAGTIQLLGAEAALFRHLRNRKKRPPKHGILFNHELMLKAPKERRGKLARTLADTIAIAARIDHFKGEYHGEELRKKVEDA